MTIFGKKLSHKGKVRLSFMAVILISFILLFIEIHHGPHSKNNPHHEIQIASKKHTAFYRYVDKKVQKLEHSNPDLKNENFDFSVYDVSNNKNYHWTHGATDVMYTASTVKVPILIALLQQKNSLSTKERNLVAGMIRNSNNSDAQALFKEIGGAPALQKLFIQLKMNHSYAYNSWWLSTIPSKDYITLLKNIFVKSDQISKSDRKYVISEMTHVNQTQRWGIDNFSSSPSFLANKNGWTLSGNWIMNSIGAVKVKGHLYLIAIMSDGHPDKTGNVGLLQGQAELDKITGFAGDFIL